MRKSIAEEAEAAMSVEGGGGLRAAPPWRGGEEEGASSVAIDEGGDLRGRLEIETKLKLLLSEEET